MKNFKKVLALALALSMILSTMTTAFAAVANTDKADVLHQLGLMDGKSTESFVPALEDEATAPEALKLIGTALGWVVDADATTTFTDVEPWAVPWVAKAVELGITNGVSETEFGSDVIDGQRLVTWFLRALGYDMTQAWEDTATLAATAGISIPTATLRDDVVGVIWEGLKSTPVGAESTLIETIILGDAAKTAIAEDAGLVDATLAITSAAIVGIKTVEVKLNKAVDTAATTVQVKKGAAIYSSSVAWNDAKNTATVTCVTELDNNVGTYTAVVTTADETLTKDFEVAAEAAATISVSATTVDDAALAAEVAFVIANQYGEDMEVAATAVTAAAYDVTAAVVVPVSNAAADSTLTLDTTGGTVEVGDVVRLTISYLGMTTQANLTVIDPASSATFGFGTITLADAADVRLTAADTGVGLGYTLLDQYGVAATLAEHDDADAAADGANDKETISDVLFISSDASVVDPDTFRVDADGVLTFTAGAAGTAVITAIINETGAVATTSIVVNGASAVDVVTISAPSALVADGEQVELNFVVVDQYGTALDKTSTAVQDILFTNATLDADGVLTTAAAVEGDFVVQAGIADNPATPLVDEEDTDAYGTVTFTVEAAAYASSITGTSFQTYIEVGTFITLDDDNVSAVDQYGRVIAEADSIVGDTADEDDITAGGTATVAATGTDTTDGVDTLTVSFEFGGATVTKDVTITAVESADIVSYTVDAVNTVYASDAEDDYNVAVALSGLDAGGHSVKLGSTAPDYITSSDESIAYADSTGLLIVGKAAGTATISAWKDGAKVASVSVTVSDAAPVAQSVAWSATTVVENAVGGLDSIVDVLDQYGVEITTTVTLFYANSNAAVNTNGTFNDFDVNIADVEITVITSNGLSATELIDLTAIVE